MNPFIHLVAVLVGLCLTVVYTAAFVFWKEFRHGTPPVRGMAVFLACVAVTAVAVSGAVAVVAFHHFYMGA